MAIQTTIKLNSGTSPKVTLPAVLTIAGSDNSGGAGIEADLKTFTAHNVYGLTCIAALTAQNTQKVVTFEKTPTQLLKHILDLNFADFLYGYPENEVPLKAIKTGMLTVEAVEVLKEYLDDLKQRNVKLVVDPVMISTTGSKLFDEEGMKVCVDNLIRNSYLVTPNFEEAKALYTISTGDEVNVSIQSKKDFVDFVIEVQNNLGCENVLVKGGHIPWNSLSDSPETKNGPQTVVLDILYQSKSDSITIFQSEYVDSKDTHGTGCTLSSSIAANLAKGLTLDSAVPLSIDYIHKGMSSLEKKLGYGNGPLNHTAIPETNLYSVIDSKSHSVNDKIISTHGTLLDYLKNHPKIKKNWITYTQHPFVKILAENNLAFDRFLYFLKQDYYYLINYAQIHALAASVAPTYSQTHSEALVIGNIVEEIERHKKKLCDKYNIDYERDIDLDIELTPGKACREYCDFLLEAGKREDYFGIKIALAPCLFGYFEAGEYGQKIRKNYNDNKKDNGIVTEEQSQVYSSWLDDYSSDWYGAAYSEGAKALQALFETTPISAERLDQFVEDFNRVTELEIAFWDEVLQ